MSSCSAGDMWMVVLTSATSGKTPAVVTIPVCGGAGVDLGGVGRALGLEPSTVTLNGHFISRGADLVSKLAWNSLLSFFAARGLPDGGSLHDPIVVRGKPIASTGHVDRLSFKRKSTINDENPYKKCRSLEGYSKKQNVGTKQLADNSCLGIKRQLKLVDDYPSKKGKIGECSSDYHYSPIMKNIDRLCSNGEVSAIDRSFGAEQEADDADFLCINKRLKFDDDLPVKKVKIDDSNSEPNKGDTANMECTIEFVQQQIQELSDQIIGILPTGWSSEKQWLEALNNNSENNHPVGNIPKKKGRRPTIGGLLRP